MADRGGEPCCSDRGGRGRGERCGGRQQEKWVPVTKLGRLVKENKIRKIEEHSLPVKDHQIIEQLVPGRKDEVTKITPVQKQTRAGQLTRFKAFVVSRKVTGNCWSVTVRMVPAPRGSGIVAARVPKKDLQSAGTEDVSTSSRGSTKRPGNCVEATFDFLMKTYGFLTPSSVLRPST